MIIRRKIADYLVSEQESVYAALRQFVKTGHRAGQLAAGRERLMLRIDTESLVSKALYDSVSEPKKTFAARLKSAFSR